MSEEAELPVGLRALAAELDALGGASNGPSVDGLPNLGGTDFRPLALLGRGGMGEVYVARQLSLDRDVAVKVLSRSLAQDDEFRRRFLDEARTVARLHHPNIVQTIGAGETNGRLFFAMERVEGSTATDCGFKRAEELVAVGIYVAEALAYAHACGVVHRDVKPSNVFIGTDGTVKLGDFGLAVLAEGRSRDRSGTKKYMSPEQRADGTTSAKSDQYSFGVMLLELAAPFPELLKNPDFAAVLDKATADDPESRYADMTRVAADLERFLRHEPVEARPAGTLRRVGLWARRSPGAAIGACAALVLLLALVASLTVGYIRTSRALEATEREAANTARSLVVALTATPTAEETAETDFRGKRLVKLRTALKTIDELALRYPENGEFNLAAERLRKAIQFTEMHGERPRKPYRDSPRRSSSR
jgi:hypothetical protein